MKTYIVEIHQYPQEFIVQAENAGEAKLKAGERFYSVNSGGSIYESVIIEEKEITE